MLKAGMYSPFPLIRAYGTTLRPHIVVVYDLTSRKCGTTGNQPTNLGKAIASGTIL